MSLKNACRTFYPVKVSHQRLHHTPAKVLCACRMVPDGTSLAFEPVSLLTGSNDAPACQEPSIWCTRQALLASECVCACVHVCVGSGDTREQ